MVYEFDLPKIIRRFVPVWFRWPENLQFGYALLARLVTMHNAFLAQRELIIDEYRYNGLVHSLEEAANDKFDVVLRRIYITIDDQIAMLYYQDEYEPPVYFFEDEGGMASYYYLDEAEMNTATAYDHEFIVHVPIDLALQTNDILALLDIYRYAGRRPKIQLF